MEKLNSMKPKKQTFLIFKISSGVAQNVIVYSDPITIVTLRPGLNSVR